MKICNKDVVGICTGAFDVDKVYLGSTLVWEDTFATYQPLCFTAEQAGSTISVVKSRATAPAITLQTSLDGIEWTPYTIGNVITLQNVGDKVYFAAGAGGNTTLATNGISNYNYFVMTGKIAASGDVTCLLDSRGGIRRLSTNYSFARLFYNCASLTQAPLLPSKGLANYCYRAMF